MKLRKILYFVGFGCILLLAVHFFVIWHITDTMSENTYRLENRISALDKEINDLQRNDATKMKNSEHTMKFLQQEYANYRDFANSERQNFIQLVNIFFIALGGLVTGASIVLFWIFGQTKKEVEENAERMIQKSAKEIAESADNKLRNLVSTEMENVEGKYRELKRLMDHQYSLRQSRVLVVSPPEQIEDMKRLEIKRMEEIVKEVQILCNDDLDFEEYEKRIEDGQVDIIIYRYEKGGKEQEVKIRKYIQSLKDRGLTIPVVVYAKRPIQVDGIDEEYVHSYPFSVMANLPTTLTVNMISLKNILSYVRR